MDDNGTQVAVTKQGTSALAIVALIFGILAIVTALIPIVNNLAFFGALLALIFGIIGIVQTGPTKPKSGRGIAVASVVLAVISIVAVLASQSYYGKVIDQAADNLSTNTHTSSVTNTATNANAASDGGSSRLQETPTLGSTVEFDDLTITFGDSLSTTTVDNRFSDLNGATILALPVSVTNHKGETGNLNMFYVTIYGAAGTELDTCYTYFDDDVRMMGDMRDGATQTGYLYFPYDANGTYYIELNNLRNKTEVEIPVAL